MNYRACWRLFLTVAAFASAFTTQAQEVPIYPDQDWPVAEPAALGVDEAAIKAFGDQVFTDTKLWRTDSVVVIYKGRIIYERYANGFTPNQVHFGWSMAKSFSTVTFGIAEAQGIAHRNETLDTFFSDLATDRAQREKMSHVHLIDELTMSSGRQWVEDYTTLNSVNSDVVHMLYLDGHTDVATYTVTRPLVDAPNDHFFYSSGNMNVVTAALKQRLGSSYLSFPKQMLFDRIGMKNVTWEHDQSGTLYGSTGIFATPRDYARFGYLLLRNGNWKGEQIVPAEWVEKLHTLSPGLDTGNVPPSKQMQYPRTYGMGFWLNLPAPKFSIPQPWPDVPQDLYAAMGHEGQIIAIVPSLDLVFIRTAHDDASGEAADAKLDWNPILKPLMQAISKANATARTAK